MADGRGFRAENSQGDVLVPTGYAVSHLTRYWNSGSPLRLELDGELPSYQLAYRTWGSLSPRADNAVMVCHALTGSADADEWWKPLFGVGKALDPEFDFIVCSNVLGGCYGSTGPTSLDRHSRPYGSAFPKLTIRDQIQAQMRLADALGIRRIRLVIGGSMGGLQALEWALLDPERVQSLAVIAASACHSAWCLSWSEAQRLALRADARFCGGNYSLGDAPEAGLGAARAIAMMTYRSPTALEQRYGREDSATIFGSRARVPEDFATWSWLRHHADRFVARFDANTYLTLLDAMDAHDVGRGRGGTASALKRIIQPALIVSISTDGLYPPSEQRAMHDALSNAELVQIESVHGHDGFLIDAAKLEPHVARFSGRSSRLRSASQRI